MLSYMVGILGIVGLMIGWVLVQSIWRHVFSNEIHDSDVLAGRSDCGSCGCTTPCSVKQYQKTKKKK